MIAVRNLACTFQRTALIVARWSGARRGEIRNLDLDCLDAFADGTPRLRIPAGKTGAERLIPLHQEAADAIRMLQASAVEARGFVDDERPRVRAVVYSCGTGSSCPRITCSRVPSRRPAPKRGCSSRTAAPASPLIASGTPLAPSSPKAALACTRS